MSLQKLKQTLNYILNVTEECAIVDAAESALVHLENAEKEAGLDATAGDYSSLKQKLESLSKINLDACDLDDLESLRDDLQDLWDKINELADHYTTLADEVDALESDVQEKIDNFSDETQSDDSDDNDDW